MFACTRKSDAFTYILVPLDNYTESSRIRKISYHVNKNIYLSLSKKFYIREYTQIWLHGFHTDFVQRVNITLLLGDMIEDKAEELSSMFVNRKICSPNERFVTLLCSQHFAPACVSTCRYLIYCWKRPHLSTMNSFVYRETWAWTRCCYEIFF